MTLEVVAIDGPAGSGKSSVARALATALAWSYLDTGAMYRAVTVVALREGADLHDPDRLGALAETLVIETLPFVSANGVNVEGDLRTSDVNRAVSLIAAVPRVRAAMVLQQRSFAARQKLGTVVEGRDITTVVFPDARLKVFLTASLDVRTRRRGEEGEASLRRRDSLDTARADSPLRQARDAMIVDTTNRTVDEVVKEIFECLNPPR
jgi:cytidylate kinase